jgi:hypothetical protein
MNAASLRASAARAGLLHTPAARAAIAEPRADADQQIGCREHRERAR